MANERISLGASNQANDLKQAVSDLNRARQRLAMHAASMAKLIDSALSGDAQYGAVRTEYGLQIVDGTSYSAATDADAVAFYNLISGASWELQRTDNAANVTNIIDQINSRIL